MQGNTSLNYEVILCSFEGFWDILRCQKLNGEVSKKYTCTSSKVVWISVWVVRGKILKIWNIFIRLGYIRRLDWQNSALDILRRAFRGVAGLPQTSKMESFATVVNGWTPLTIVAKLSILDVCGGPDYASGLEGYRIFRQTMEVLGRHVQSNIHWSSRKAILTLWRYSHANYIATNIEP